MQQPYMIVERFFDEADALRAAFEAHFKEPRAHSSQHQVWNYWFVPELYMYLRTSPGTIIPNALVERFGQRLNAWAMATLGLSSRSNPWLSLYVNGCGQGLHNDSLNGQMGYVFSITKWDEKNFLGGETILFHPENYWESERIKTSGAGSAFYDKVPARFNQLLVFDDRVIHGVQPLQGTMDPLAGRLVLHGHLKAEGGILNGALSGDAVLNALTPTLDKVRVLTQQHAPLFHGFTTLRMAIQPEGRVASVQCLCDRILPLSSDKSQLEPFRQQLVQLLSSVLFPSAQEASELTLPVFVGS
ncbi:MAG TPA: hypothetical protein VN688_28880 [Gemmataceae bacterium]|nr:hypothetical protein [Gemmataceae bacterium]